MLSQKQYNSVLNQLALNKGMLNEMGIRIKFLKKKLQSDDDLENDVRNLENEMDMVLLSVDFLHDL
jgi:hypothetical protein